MLSSGRLNRFGTSAWSKPMAFHAKVVRVLTRVLESRRSRHPSESRWHRAVAPGAIRGLLSKRGRPLHESPWAWTTLKYRTLRRPLEHGLSTSPEVSSASIIVLASAQPDDRAHFEASADAERRANAEGGCSLDDDSPAPHVSLTSPEPFPTRTRWTDRRKSASKRACKTPGSGTVAAPFQSGSPRMEPARGTPGQGPVVNPARRELGVQNGTPSHRPCSLGPLGPAAGRVAARQRPRPRGGPCRGTGRAPGGRAAPRRGGAGLAARLVRRGRRLRTLR